MADNEEALTIGLGGDVSDFKEMISEAIRLTEKGANDIATATTKMATATANDLKKASTEWHNYASSVDRATASHTRFKSSKPTALGPDTFNKADFMKGLMDEVNAHVDTLGTTTAELKALEEEMTLFQHSAKHFPTVLGEATPLLGMFSTEAASAASSMAALGELALPASLMLGTLAASLGGVTYAISGWEGVKNIPANLLEGLKYGLYGATLGWVDYTAKTAAAKEGDKAYADQLEHNRTLIAETLEARRAAVTGIDEKVKALTNHSKEAEEAFIKALRLTSREGGGFTPGQAETVEQRYAAAFQGARVEETLDKLKDEATTYKYTKEQIALYTLELNNATEAQKNEARALFAKMEAIDAEAKAKKDAEAKAKETAREVVRERERVDAEAKALHDSLRTPVERLQAEARRAIELFKMGKIGAEDLKRVMDKLDEGPKEHAHHIKLVTTNEAGIDAKVVGSTEYAASVEAYRLNALSEKTAKAKDERMGPRGEIVPGPRLADSKMLTKEETETRKVLAEMKGFLATISAHTDPRKTIRISPAKLGGGRK